MAALLAQLTPAEKADAGVHHALQVHASLATSNYVRFFRLFNSAPNMSGYIMDHFVERERVSALLIMSKAYVCSTFPNARALICSYLTVPLPQLTTTLSFDSDRETDQFLVEHSCAIYKNATPEPVSSGPWKSLAKPKPVPLHERIWDSKTSHDAVRRAGEKYRVVDLKGQVD